MRACAALPEPRPWPSCAPTRATLAADMMFEFLALCYKPWLTVNAMNPMAQPTNQQWAWRTNGAIAAAMKVQDDGVYYVLTKMLVRNVQGHAERATAAEVRDRPPGRAHARVAPSAADSASILYPRVIRASPPASPPSLDPVSQRAQALEALDTLLNAAQNLAAQNLERTHRLTARPRRASRVRRSRLMRTAHTLGRLHAHNRMSTARRGSPADAGNE